MIYVTVNDPIERLPLSTRSYKAFKNAHINTVGELLEWYKNRESEYIRNFGAKSKEEVVSLIDEMLNGQGEFCLWRSENQGGDKVSAPCERSIPDMMIYDLPLSPYARIALNKSGFVRASQIVGITESIIHTRLRGGYISKDVIKEIIDCSKEYSRQLNEYIKEHKPLKVATENEQERHDLFEALTTGLKLDGSTSLEIIDNVQKRCNNFNSDEFISFICENSILVSALEKAIIVFLDTNEGTYTKNEVIATLPSIFQDNRIIERVLKNLEKKDEIYIDDIIIKRNYPSIIKTINETLNDRELDIIRRRLDGQTLEEISREYGFTRERVCQISAKALRRVQKKYELGAFPKRFDEDKYVYIFEKYHLSIEDFKIAFDEPFSTYYYLNLITSNNRAEKKSLDTALEDDHIPRSMRRLLERAVYKHCILIDGVRIIKQRSELVHYYIKTRCTDKTDYDAFYENYHRWLIRIGLPGEEYRLDYKSYKNKLNSSDYVLWNQWSCFRYYDINSNDYNTLLSTLNFESYNNIELSTLKWFRDYPELMKEYDIRDEYELHNLLKKISIDPMVHITFCKMPTIVIGTANRDEQVLELLLACAPIEANEFANKYEELYGVKAKTVLANYLDNFNEYFFNGVYSIDAHNLPYFQFYNLKTILTEDYYTIARVKQIYSSLYPNSDENQINPYTLKTLGFHVYGGSSGYIIGPKFEGAREYFEHLLMDSEMVDGNLFDYSLYCNTSFTSILSDLKVSRTIVEYEPKKYINISKLEKMDITLDVIDQFCESVIWYVGNDSFFTIKSLKQDGFSDLLFTKHKFKDWFYGSLLCEDERFSSRRVGGTRLFCQANRDFVFGDFLFSILEVEEKISIDELNDLLETHYGIVIPKDKLIYLIRNTTELYYDGISKMVFFSREMYDGVKDI